MRSTRSPATSIASVALVSALALAGCSSSDEAAAAGSSDDAPETVTVEFERDTAKEGEEPDIVSESIEVPYQPENVVVLDMATFDTLGALDVEVAGTALDSVPDYLEQYVTEDTFNAGSLFEPDLVAIEASQPDLIIVANRSAAAYDDLAEIAPTIDLTLGWSDFLADFEQNVTVLGEIFGKQDEAAEAWTGVEQSIEEASATAAEAGSGLVVQVSGGDVSAYGPSAGAEGRAARFGLVYDVFGVEPAVEDVATATHGEPVSFEFLLENNPDWLLVVDREAVAGDGSGQSAEQVLDNEIMHQTTAWQEDQIVYLDPSAWYIVMSGISTVDRMVDDISSLVP